VLNKSVFYEYKNRASYKIYLSFVVFLASIFIGTLITSHSAHAATIDLSPSNQIKSYSSFNALTQCTRMGQWNTSVAKEDASSPSKWLGDDKISVGYLVDTSDGLQECNKIIKSALDLWGYSGKYEDALKAFGYSLVDVPNCTGVGSLQQCNGKTSTYVKPSSQNTLLQKFQTTIKNNVYGGSTPTLEGRPDLLYLRGKTHLETSTACNASAYKKVSDLSADEKQLYKDNEAGATSGSNAIGSKDYLIVKLVDGTTRKTEDWVYKIPQSNWLKIIKLNEAPSGGSVEYTCVKIAKDMSGYSNRVVDDIKALTLQGKDPSVKYASILTTPNGSNASGDSKNNDSPGDTASSCTIDGVGWILCPVLTFTGGIVDAAYNFIAGLLVIKPLITTGGSGREGVYVAWGVMRNIANVAFVIAFLFIVFSQLTGVGISNYGVKKLLPRVVIAAILVNVSFWICAIAVDLSNVIGASIVNVFDSVGTQISQTFSTTINDGSSTTNGSDVWTNLVGSILAGGITVGIIYYVGLAALIPALLAALVAIVTVFLVLTLRQALIILLIVVSPLAFVAYLLPNTEDYFTKWRKFFTTLLLMYPIIAGLFGASALASMIIMKGSEGNIIVQIMGACIAILPLAITPLVMKTAGGVLNRFGGMINNPNRGPVDRLRKAGAGYQKQRADSRNMRALGGATQGGRGAVVRWRARRESIASNLSNEASRSKTEYVAGQFENNGKFRNAAAGGTLLNDASQSSTQRALANAINVQTKLEADEVNAAKAVIEHANLSGSERQTLATTGAVSVPVRDSAGNTTGQSTTYSSPIMQKAAIQEQMRTGSMGQIHQIVSSSGTEGMKQFSQTISQSVASNGIASKNPALGGATIDIIAQGGIKSQDDLDKRVLAAVKEGKFNAENVASMHDDAREMAIRVTGASGDVAAKDALKDSALKIKNTPVLSSKVTGNVKANEQLERISRL
jgi:hypothetical protein